MPELIFYPDADPESTSVDGIVDHSLSAGLTWATLIAAAGSDAYDDGDYQVGIHIESHITETDKWRMLRRTILLFDTSALPNNAVITNAILSIYLNYKSDSLGITPNVNVFSSAPVSNVALEAGDYDGLGAIPFCDTAIGYTGWVAGAYNDFELNTAGIAAISKTGITKLGLRNANYDVAGTPPTWTANKTASFEFKFAESDSKPKLTITYIIPPAVTTDSATMTNETSATLNGTLTDDGGEDCDCGFQWGTSNSYGNTTATVSKTEGQTFSQSISGLSPNSSYHYRAFGTNSVGTGYGDDATLTANWEEHSTTALRLLSFDCRGIWYPTMRNIITCTVLCADNLVTRNGTDDGQTGAVIKTAIEEARDTATWPITFYDRDGNTIYVKVLSAKYRATADTKDKNPEGVFDLVLLKVPLS